MPSTPQWGILLIGALLAAYLGITWQASDAIVYQDRVKYDFDPSLLKFNATGQSKVCTLLADALPDNVYSHHHPLFDVSVKVAYAWQAHSDVPSCIVRPFSADQVSRVVKVLKSEYDAKHDARFAVRSGGHHIGVGHSSIRDGVLLDLSGIDEITVEDGQQSTIIGTGVRWGSVYQKLEPLGLAVAGGRNPDVGVGGFTLGGGISYLAPLVGMVCDNVLKYEVILADGSIVYPSATEHTDLWQALKGGSSNFGIVTRFWVYTFSLRDIWGGHVFYPLFEASRLYKAFYEYMRPEAYDEYAAGIILSLGYDEKWKSSGAFTSLVYTKPEKWPKVFRAFKAAWRFWSTMKIQSLAQVSADLHSVGTSEQRQSYATLTIKNELPTLLRFPEVFNRHVPSVKGIKGMNLAFTSQPLSAAIISKSSPNVLGLSVENSTESSLIIVLICLAWDNEEDDARVHEISRAIHADVESLARERGIVDRYLYLNYAGGWQDPIAGYGEENIKFMAETSRKHDPDGFYQVALEGGFKLGTHRR